MATFAEIKNGIVVNVIVIDDANASDAKFIQQFGSGQFVQTSYNTYQNKHYSGDGADRKADDQPALRGNYAGIGYAYDAVNDVFYRPQPFPSWTLDKTIWDWAPPTPYPDDYATKPYKWNEATKTFEAVT